MKKFIKIIIAVFIVVVFVRAVIVMTNSVSSTAITKDCIAVLDISGQIMGSDYTIKQLKQLKDNPLVKGVILRVDSPGGAVTPSMEIYNYVNNMRKPVYAAMGSVAASGGYLISLGADKIYAEPSTITGSIGVIMNLVNSEELMNKIGIKSVVIKSGEFKDTGSPAREMTEEDRQVLTAVLMDMYNQFVDIVANRRGLQRDKVLELADGRIYTGKMAKEVKLVNELGSWHDAYLDMKEKHSLGNIEYYEVPVEKTLLEEFLDPAGKSEIGKIISNKTGFFYLTEVY